MKVNCPWEKCKYNIKEICTKEELYIHKMVEWPPSCMEEKKQGKEPAHNLKDVKFPECAKKCALIKYFGVGECECVCSWKFDKNGKPI